MFLAVALSVLVAGCEESRSKRQAPEFHAGDIVTMKIDQRKGTVLSVWERDPECDTSYNVRFPNGSTSTDTHLLSSDGDLASTPYGEVRVCDFELMHRTPQKK